MRLLLSLVLLMIVLVPWSRAQEEPKTEIGDEPPALRYGERPLSGDDFLAPVPEKRPIEDPRAEAYSHTVVNYRYQYKRIRRGGKVRAQLTAIQFFAEFDRLKSWNAIPDNARLLEHHNGHFDIAQISALEMQLDWAERLKKEKIAGSGSSEKAAVADLEKKIDELVRAQVAGMQREHEYFDQTTRYGTDEDIEQRERERQRQRLKELEEKLSSNAR